MFLAGNCHCLAAPVTAFSRFSGVCLMILAAKWWIASLFKMLHLAFYGVRAFERSMYSTLVPEQQLWKQRCFPILAVLCQQMRCSVLDDKHVKRWIIFIHTHDAVESGKAHDVMVKGMKEMLAVWLAFRKTCRIQQILWRCFWRAIAIVWLRQWQHSLDSVEFVWWSSQQSGESQVFSRCCIWHSTVCVPLNAACTQPWCLNSSFESSDAFRFWQCFVNKWGAPYWMISMWRDESYSFILMMLWKVARRMMSWWKEWKKCLLFDLLLEKHVKYSRFCEDVSGGQLPLFGCASDSIL